MAFQYKIYKTSSFCNFEFTFLMAKKVTKKPFTVEGIFFSASGTKEITNKRLKFLQDFKTSLRLLFVILTTVVSAVAEYV